MTVYKRFFCRIFGITLTCSLLLMMWFHTDDKSLTRMDFRQYFGENHQRGCPVSHADDDEMQELKGKFTLPTPVLILTYMRSGSTFLGDVIQSSDDVFYIFEPLRSLELSLRPIKDLDGNIMNGSLEEISNDVIRHAFLCQLRKLPKTFFAITAFLNVSRTTQDFITCTKKNSAIQCAELLELRCRHSTHVLIKSIRLRAYSLLNFKKDFANLKIIQLQRDPRVVLQRQRKFGLFGHLELSTYVSSYCTNVTNDTRIIRQLHKCYSNDVIFIYYEIFGANSVFLSRKLYRELNLTFSETVRKEIKGLTENSECTRHWSLCTNHFVSSDVMSQWRRKIDLAFVQIVDNLCRDLYVIHGYVSLPFAYMLTNLTYKSQNTDLSSVPFLH